MTMRHSIKPSYSSNKVSNVELKLSHHEGSYMSHHGGSHMSHHGGSHVSHHGGSHLSYNRDPHLSHHIGSHLSHNRGSHLTPHGCSYMSHQGGGSHNRHQTGSQLSHPEGFKKSHKLHIECSQKMHFGSSNLSHHGLPHKAHYGGSHHQGQHKAFSIHGGSSRKTVSFSKQPSINYHRDQSQHSGTRNIWKNDGMLSMNEKETMQILNKRLSSYLDKVSTLEQENAQLEKKICEWYLNNAPSSLPDSSQYFRMITDLQRQIAAATMENSRIILQTDNDRLTAGDIRDKYEIELLMSNSAAADLNALCSVLEELNRETCDLEMQVKNLQQELQEMKRNHEEEVTGLRAQLGARVNVEMNVAPSIDLNGALSEIRDEYENLMERNLRDAENIFRQRIEELNRQVSSGSEQLQSVQTDVIELKRTVQTLGIELQSQLSMTSALECTLAETQATYGSQIAQLQAIIDNVESQLAQIRSDLERQNYEYKILMDQKTHLEMEIATYKRLLVGHDIHLSEYHMSTKKYGTHTGSVHESKC